MPAKMPRKPLFSHGFTFGLMATIAFTIFGGNAAIIFLVPIYHILREW